MDPKTVVCFALGCSDRLIICIMPRGAAVPTPGRTSSLSLDSDKQIKIFEYLCEYEPQGLSWNNYCNQFANGIFGPRGDPRRKRGRDRITYLKRLKDSDPGSFLRAFREWQPQAYQVPNEPDSVCNSSSPDTDQLPFFSSVSSQGNTRQETMNQVKEKVLINFQFPEKNEEVIPIRLDQMRYRGELLTICQMIIVEKDPRSLLHLAAHWNSDYNTFELKSAVFPDNLVGMDGKKNFCEAMMSEAFCLQLIDWDSPDEDEATDLASRCATNFMVWANKMVNEENPHVLPDRRIQSRKFVLPEGMKARKDMFGCRGRRIHIHLISKPFNYGKKINTSHTAIGTFFFALETSEGDTVVPLAHEDPMDRLEQAIQG